MLAGGLFGNMTLFMINTRMCLYNNLKWEFSRGYLKLFILMGLLLELEDFSAIYKQMEWNFDFI